MHVLQPRHTKLDEKEAEKVLTKYNLSPTQLPKISSKDPALDQKCKKGDIVKIERTGDMAEVYFRIVI